MIQISISFTDISKLEAKIDHIERECKIVAKENLHNSVDSVNKKENNFRKNIDNSILYREGAKFFQKGQYDKAKERFHLMLVLLF